MKWVGEIVGVLCSQISERERKKKTPCRKLGSCELDQMSEVKLTTGEPEAQ